MIASRREDVLQDAAARLTAESDGNQVLYHAVDLTNRASTSAFATHAISALGGVDIFVGNAGIDISARIEDIKDEAIDAMCQANIGANVSVIRAFLRACGSADGDESCSVLQPRRYAPPPPKEWASIPR